MCVLEMVINVVVFGMYLLWVVIGYCVVFEDVINVEDIIRW